MKSNNLDRAIDIMDTIESVKTARNNEARSPAPNIRKMLDYCQTIELLENSLAYELRRIRSLQRAS